MIDGAAAYPGSVSQSRGATALADLFVLVSDGHAAATIDENLGAKLHMPPMNIQESGRMAVMAYPQGAAFAVFASASLISIRRNPGRILGKCQSAIHS